MVNKNGKEVWRMLINEWKINVEGAGATKIEEGKHFPRLAPSIYREERIWEQLWFICILVS